MWHYNIGFFDFDRQVLSGRVDIRWMTHPYKDRLFADPFILDMTLDEIKVLVEELFYHDGRGRITLLAVDRKTFGLMRRKVLLDLPTHLSFPFIHRTENNGIYVIPENYQSGGLHAYRWDSESETLTRVSSLVEQPLIDSVVIRDDNGKYLLFGSLPGKRENADLFVWQSEEPLQGYKRVASAPIISGRPDCARRGGDFFMVGGTLYSAVQSCVHSYGEVLRICKVNRLSENCLEEENVAVLYPDKRYPDGLHTFNHYKGLCVVDGMDHLFRPGRKLMNVLKASKECFLGLSRNQQKIHR